MKSIEKISNSPQVCGVWFVEPDELTSMDQYNDAFSVKIMWPSELRAEWHRLYFTTPCKYSNDVQRTSAGQLYTHKLEGFLPAETLEQVSNIHDLENRKLILKLEFTNGENRIMGNQTKPVEVKRSHNEGYNFEITWQSEMPLLFINSEEVIS